MITRSISISFSASLIAVTFAASAHADDASAPPPEKHGERTVPSDVNRIIFETGRTPVTAADEEHTRVQIHGEYQLRFQSQSSYLLTPTTTTINNHAGQGAATGDSIGQNNFLMHWLRVMPRFQLRDKLEVIAQADIGGIVMGDLTHDVNTDYSPRDEYDGFKNVQPRWLYLDWLTPVGLVRAGQAPNHWGMGLVANDGDHPSLFGDYRYGNISEQLLFATKPLGKESPFVVAVSGALVYRDNTARLTRGDHAWQGVLAAFYEEGPNMLGIYGVYRHQTRDNSSDQSDLFPFTESIDAGVVDVAGHFAAPIFAPGSPAFVFGAAEGATIIGSTNELRTLADAANGTRTQLRSYGGAVSLGFALGAHRDYKPDPDHPTGAKARPDLYGKFVSQIEIGYASGDADPYGDTNKRFVFDPNHKVGLLLFDEVMRWSTARAAVAAKDPLLTNAANPPPGVDLLASNGGVFGAQYVNPTMIFRPREWLDLKGGVLVAQTTADMVDPYRLATQGAYVNYQGGPSARHDLGLELDGGFETRIPLDHRVRLQLGAQAGVLFPGGALADMEGVKLKTPWLAIGRAGLQF